MGPVPAAKEGKHDPASPVRPVACQRPRVDRAVGAGHRLLGRELRNRLEYHVDQPQDGLGITAHRLGSLDRKDRRRVDPELHRFQNTSVGRHIAENMLKRHVTAATVVERDIFTGPWQDGRGPPKSPVPFGRP